MIEHIAPAAKLAGRAERELLEIGDTEQATDVRELLLLALDEDIAPAAKLAGRAERELLEIGDTEQAIGVRELLKLASQFQAALDALADSQGPGEAELEDDGPSETATETETADSESEWTLERVLAIDGVSEALDGSQIVNASEISSNASGVALVLTDGAYPGDRDDYLEVQDVKQRLRALLAPFGIGVE